MKTRDKKSRKKLKIFFKSFLVSEVVLLCLIALLIGFTSGYAIMEYERTGREVKIIEIKQNKVFFLENEVLRLKKHLDGT